jgi:quinolinate synthase
MSALLPRGWKSQLAARLARVMPDAEAALCLPLIEEIRELKARRGALGVADFTGDSLAMARHAAQSDAATIVVCGVRFMAETAKLLNPTRTVLLPAAAAGCSLAEAITAADVRRLRQRHPGVPLVAYVNTTAAVKAEVDICCTSANAVAVVESLRAPRVIVLPDRYLAAYVAARVACEVIAWQGACEVHERFSAEDLAPFRDRDVLVLAHPECREEVQRAADFVGSTTAMARFLGERRPARALLLTECSMADNITVDYPEIRFERPCNLCQHMKQITLARVRDALLDGVTEIHIDPPTARRARLPLERMLAL